MNIVCPQFLTPLKSPLVQGGTIARVRTEIGKSEFELSREVLEVYLSDVENQNGVERRGPPRKRSQRKNVPPCTRGDMVARVVPPFFKGGLEGGRLGCLTMLIALVFANCK